MSQQMRSEWIEQAKEHALANEKRADGAVAGLMTLYDEAAYRVEKEINAMSAKFAKDNQLTEAQASQLLNGKEYRVWRKSIDEYLAEASGQASDSKVLLELNTLAMKSRITRKEELLSNIYRNMADLAGDTNAKLEELLADMVRVNYYEGCYHIQQGIGMAFHTARIDEALVRRVLEHPWSERHFSEAVWGQCDHLAALARREIGLGLISGSSVQKMAKAIDEVMDKGRYAAERLVRTECKYFANQGELAAYRENGITKYRFVGGSEGSGHCICASLNGQVFDVDRAEPGVNYPPIHPNCLCIVVAAFERSMFDSSKDGEPLAKSESFERWKKKYVDNPPPPAKIKLSPREEHALNSYISSDSYMLNRKLRGGEPLSAREKRLVSSLDSALEKLPEYRGTLYRSISNMEIENVEEFIKAHHVGDAIPFPAFTSTSTEVYDDSMPIQYVIQSRHGRDARTANRNEQEVLFRRDTTFYVTKVEGHTIYLEEAEHEKQ